MEATKKAIRGAISIAQTALRKERMKPIQRDPLLFWPSVLHISILHNTIKGYLCAPASSSSPERFFSNSGNVECGRTNLGGDNMAMISRIRDQMNGPSFNFNSLVEKLEEVIARNAGAKKAAKKTYI